MRCSRCGREGEVEYGSDGQAYCNSCIFYGLNKPCFRCRMYLPASELQQFKGQWVCPYCLMDMRDEDRRAEAASGGGEGKYEGYRTSETCDRCGRQLSVVYYFNGKKLCESCLEDAKKEWKDTGGEKPPLPMYRVTEKEAKEAGKQSFIEALFSNLLGLLGIRRRKKAEPEIVAMRRPARRTPAGEGKPLAKKMAQETANAKPMAEGPENKEAKEGPRKSQDVSFAQYAQEEKKENEEGAQKGKKEEKKKKFGGFKKE